MTNLLAQAINCDDGDRAARIIQDALGIENDDVVNYCFPEGMAGRPRAARQVHRRVAEDRGALPGLMTKDRRFPPPWSVGETDAKLDRRRFIVHHGAHL
jgi:hypothetical protein